METTSLSSVAREMTHHSHKRSEVTRLRLSEELARLALVCEGDSIAYVTLLKHLRSRGQALITLFFSIPFVLPMPLPGLSIPFGMIIFYVGIRLALNQKPWLPRRILRKRLPAPLLRRTFMAAQKILLKFERWIKPRGQSLVERKGLQTINGAGIAFCGFLLALPLPPGTNFPPATAIILLSIGVLESDLALLIVGYLSVLINIALFGALAFFGVEGFNHARLWLTSLF